MTEVQFRFYFSNFQFDKMYRNISIATNIQFSMMHLAFDENHLCNFIDECRNEIQCYTFMCQCVIVLVTSTFARTIYCSPDLGIIMYVRI